MSDRLLFISRRPPYPLTNGARVRTHRLVTGLSDNFDVTFLTYAHHAASPDGAVELAQLEAALPGIRVIAVPGMGPRKRASQLRSLASRRSWAMRAYEIAGFANALERAVSEVDPALVHFDDLATGQFGPVPGRASVLSTHNVEHRILLGAATGATGARRAFNTIEWLKLRREETRLWRSMPLCLAVSEIDAETMRAEGARVEVCPNGTDPVDRLPLPAPTPGLRLLFVGSGDFQPYERGLAWFVDEVFTQLPPELSATFDVVGTPPRRPIAARGVRYVGRVESVMPWYAMAHAVVVPIFEGSGTRLKVIEAMAYGRPVLSTRLGSEGLPVRPGTHYLAGETAAQWTQALVELAAQLSQAHPEVERMLSAAREAVAPLAWPGIVDELAERYRAEISSQHQQAA